MPLPQRRRTNNKLRNLLSKGLAGSAADDKAYHGLDSAILELTPKVRSDFVKPKPSPNVHSNLTPASRMA
jgi:hypothetical protein